MRSLIAMAHNLGLGVIAEGVETEAQAGVPAARSDCEEAQGFLMPSRCRPPSSRPICGPDPSPC